MTLSIVDFLKARIEEDRVLAQAAIDDLYGPDDCYFDTSNRHIVDHYLRHDPARVLREVTAKRRIVEAEQDRVLDEGPLPEHMRGSVETDVLALLALPYADHPDYREEWAA